MKKLFAPLLAASLSSTSCSPAVSDINSSPSSVGCASKECFLEAAFGTRKEGLQPDGSLVTCVNRIESPDTIIAKAKKQYNSIHDCNRIKDPKREFIREMAVSHRLAKNIDGIISDTALTCAMVSDTKSDLHCHSGIYTKY